MLLAVLLLRQPLTRHRLLRIARLEVVVVDDGHDEEDDGEDEQRERRLVVLGRGGEEAEEPGREDAAAVGVDEEDGERGGAADVWRGVVGDPGLQWGCGAVDSGEDEEERAVPDVADGRPCEYVVRLLERGQIVQIRTEEHGEADDGEQGVCDRSAATESEMVREERGND